MKRAANKDNILILHTEENKENSRKNEKGNFKERLLERMF